MNTRVLVMSIVPACLLVLMLLGGCRPNPGIGGIDRYAATTPQTFTEGRVFFLDEPTKGPEGRPLRKLLHPYETNENLDQVLDASNRIPGSVTVDTATVIGERYILHNQPLSIIVSKVIAPPFEGTRDIAVILDITTEEDIGEQPLVVWYQRDVRGGDALNFENLIVYYDRAWDSKVPPYFHLRLLDVENEDNAATRQLLSKVQGLVTAIGGFVPHPAIPGVQLGIEAGKQVLGNLNNTVLMDYTVQFYAAEDRSTAGGADLGYLRKGHWTVIGRNKDYDCEFWAEPMFMDQQTLRIYTREDGSMQPLVMPATPTPGPSRRPLVQVPSILMTVTTAESVVPTIVLDRSTELTKLLSAAPASQDFDAVETKIRTLASGVKAYLIARRVQREQTSESMQALRDALQDHKQAETTGAPVDASADRLSTGDAQLLLLTAERACGQSFGGVQEFLDWWLNHSQGWSFQYDETLGRKVWREGRGA